MPPNCLGLLSSRSRRAHRFSHPVHQLCWTVCCQANWVRETRHLPSPPAPHWGPPQPREDSLCPAHWAHWGRASHTACTVTCSGHGVCATLISHAATWYWCLITGDRRCPFIRTAKNISFALATLVHPQTAVITLLSSDRRLGLNWGNLHSIHPCGQGQRRRRLCAPVAVPLHAIRPGQELPRPLHPAC